MKFMLAIVCLFAYITAAVAQYGVSNARDGSGNLVRDTGMNPSRTYGQPSVNNLNGSNRNLDPARKTNSAPIAKGSAIK
jgi:hypothetical protein